MKCFGTDGEVALIDAFQHECPRSLHLICSIHVRKNTKAKLQDLGIPEQFRTLIMDDIFGKKLGAHYNEGLVDATSEMMYDKVFLSLTRKWREFETSITTLNKFIEWFRSYKSSIVKKSMLRPVREKAGLGRPPSPFMTNASESINALLKKKVNYKRNELPEFLEKVRELIREQDSEIEKAVINRGKYMINPEFKKFSKTEKEWFTKMKEGDRVRHLQRFASFKLPVSSVLVKSSSCPQSLSTSGNVNDEYSAHDSSLGTAHSLALGSDHNSSLGSPHGSSLCSVRSSSHGFSLDGAHSSSLSTAHNTSLGSAHSSSHGSSLCSAHSSSLSAAHNTSLSSAHSSSYNSSLGSGHGSI